MGPQWKPQPTSQTLQDYSLLHRHHGTRRIPYLVPSWERPGSQAFKSLHFIPPTPQEKHVTSGVPVPFTKDSLHQLSSWELSSRNLLSIWKGGWESLILKDMRSLKNPHFQGWWEKSPSLNNSGQQMQSARGVFIDYTGTCGCNSSLRQLHTPWANSDSHVYREKWSHKRVV